MAAGGRRRSMHGRFPVRATTLRQAHHLSPPTPWRCRQSALLEDGALESGAAGTRRRSSRRSSSTSLDRSAVRACRCTSWRTSRPRRGCSARSRRPQGPTAAAGRHARPVELAAEVARGESARWVGPADQLVVWHATVSEAGSRPVFRRALAVVTVRYWVYTQLVSVR